MRIGAVRTRLQHELRGLRSWRALVPVICLVAGFGFATSAHDSRGTDLRAPGTANLQDLVRQAEARVRAADAQVSGLQQQVTAATGQAGRDDSAVAAAQRSVAPLRVPGGLSSMTGPGLAVVLDDAPSVPAGVDPNQGVVHQSDLQAVVNALWAGGAEAMSINGQRIVATSAVQCVGPTLLLNGEVYSPPFRVAAIGPSRTMQMRLGQSPGVRLFQQAASYYGLGYTVETLERLTVPAYTGPLTLTHAKAGR
ncbi:MAG: DUF881 domain-containing protein [Jatrophihabitans sp.]|uniref:DUF881 domain-containing protein n=1 Tax=Jatrophihabitans sp. TaxID=1932789 RepID=UPI003F7CD407